MIRKHIIFTGSVQGVGFRYRARHAAELYGCTGWVRNEYDGSVVMEIQGTEEQIDRVLTAFGAGDVLTLQNEIRELDYLIRAAKAKGLRVALTPAPMNEAVEKLPLDLIDYLFLNEVECAALLHADAEADPIGAAQTLRERFGIGSVVLTLGGEGSAYAGAEGCFRQAAVPAEAVDTTGAGDTYAGFFLGGVLSRLDVPTAMRYASTAASIAISRPGASASIPSREEVLGRMV